MNFQVFDAVSVMDYTVTWPKGGWYEQWLNLMILEANSMLEMQHDKSATECYANLLLTFVAVPLSGWWQMAKGSEAGGSIPKISEMEK